jgi:putative hydrolase of the HAD superfamily
VTAVGDYRAVVLDLFDTLVRWDPSRLPELDFRGRRFHTTMPWLLPELARALGERFRPEGFLDAYAAVLKEIDTERGAELVEVTCTERFRRALERIGVTGDEGASLGDLLTRRHMAGVRSVTFSPPEWAAVVPRLAKRYRLGLVSNFDDAATGREILGDTGVAHHFDVVVISAEVRRRKPHPEIFRCALDALELTPREVLFVGDTPREDVLGARGIGMPVVWLSDRKGPFPRELEPADHTIGNLADLPALLGLRDE